MCGIAGIFNVQSGQPVDESILHRMTDSLFHRGPDEDGYLIKSNIGLGMRRLSIIDLSGGSQPIYNEDRTLAVVFNGEIFNYIELRDELEKKGHCFRTGSDTEVIVHLYEQYGTGFLDHMNGQFAIALWDDTDRKLILARDRVGIRPLFYAVTPGGDFLFGSEMKTIFCHPEANPEIDWEGINQVFTLWVNVPPRTVFRNVSELVPGHYLILSAGGMRIHRYWSPRFPDENGYDERPLEHYSDTLKELLYDSVTLRLRADVPVASYLSGGIDSSIISALVKKYHNNELITFSVAFSDPRFDERAYQMDMVSHLKTDHRMIEATYENIGDVFSDVVRFSEKPMIRTAPGPLFLLSKLVRSHNIKVVLTGEGADEVFGGYNIFKEDKIRRFWAKDPGSDMRPVLLQSLYPYIGRDARAFRFWQLFFKKGLTDTENPFYSHLIRWGNTSQIKGFFKEEYRRRFSEESVFDALREYVDPDMRRWHPLSRAQYLEMVLFMSGYLLSSQGDRMMMGNSVEGRFPFLDYRIIEFAGTIPPRFKLNVLNEKYILKKAYGDILPDSVVNRPKQPYRAPIGRCFTGTGGGRMSTMLSRESIENSGYFDYQGMEGLLRKFSSGEERTGERDEMALVGIVSLQLLHHHFIKGRASPEEKI